MPQKSRNVPPFSISPFPGAPRFKKHCRRPKALNVSALTIVPKPHFEEEEALHRQGFRYVAGVDEAGRGPLAGPVTAGAAVFAAYPSEDWAERVRDSKRMTAKARESVAPAIRASAAASAVGTAGHREVDDVGIVEATRLAMMRAIERLPVRPDFLLVDAVRLPDVRTPQKSIIRGDSTCFSIAAASILAKVYRDLLMARAERSFPGYGFAGHKGYPSARHVEALRRLGPCPIHRRSFAPVKALIHGEAAGT